jgi:hypothetical protein
MIFLITTGPLILAATADSDLALDDFAGFFVDMRPVWDCVPRGGTGRMLECSTFFLPRPAEANLRHRIIPPLIAD